MNGGRRVCVKHRGEEPVYGFATSHWYYELLLDSMPLTLMDQPREDWVKESRIACKYANITGLYMIVRR